ncbi:MAG: hypothetical protein KAT47_01100 [Candidatus Aegiribacteria sp.]|nr:hypothetical protein [Candidatus Aegiribacteria sp.]
MKYISLLLHLYQPPTQEESVVTRIDNECYKPLSKLLFESGVKITVNINYSLTEQLDKPGSESLRNLAAADGIEFTDSGAYHPIFPLINEYDIRRQLQLNRNGNSRVLGANYSPEGVFPPEMAYSPSLAPLLLDMGYTWTVTDDVPWVWTGRAVPCRTIPVVNGIAVLLRSNFWSNRISFHGDNGSEMADEIIEGMRDWSGDEDSYLLIAMDGETFGHHRKGTIETFLSPFLSSIESFDEVLLVTPSELIRRFPSEDASVPSGSWSTTAADMVAGKPWPLWDDPDNMIHVSLRGLLDHVRNLALRCNSDRVASLADKMLYSCPFWWASADRFDAVQVRRGLLAILETAQAIFTETGDREMMDAIMSTACSIPVITGKD